MNCRSVVCSFTEYELFIKNYGSFDTPLITPILWNNFAWLLTTYVGIDSICSRVKFRTQSSMRDEDIKNNS